MLALAASFCTATASVCQRSGARSEAASGLGLNLLLRLARRPVWVAGLASMILGFGLQLSALHSGTLALVQPILSVELIFVFASMAVISQRRVKLRDWLAALAMCAGLGLFLFAASPSGGRLHAPGRLWWTAGLTCLAVVAAALALAFGPGRRSGQAPARRAAALGAATGISWGFVAAVTKELSSHLADGIGAIASSWSLYVLAGAGLATLLLGSHALAAGPLTASQPGFTIGDPLSATLLGLFLYGEHIQTSPLHLAGQALGLLLLITGVSVLSHSSLLTGEDRQAHQRPPTTHTPRTEALRDDLSLDVTAKILIAAPAHAQRARRMRAAQRRSGRRRRCRRP